jgi:hypothetical protein
MNKNKTSTCKQVIGNMKWQGIHANFTAFNPESFESVLFMAGLLTYSRVIRLPTL